MKPKGLALVQIPVASRRCESVWLLIWVEVEALDGSTKPLEYRSEKEQSLTIFVNCIGI